MQSKFVRLFSARIFTLSAAALLTCSAAVLAIEPGHWVHTSEADFEPGENDKTVVTNLGDVKLAAGSETVGEAPEAVTIFYDMQELADGTLYIAGGPEASLLRRDGDKLEQLLTLKDEQMFTLAQFENKLLVGISGEQSRVAVLEDGQLTNLHVFEDVRYIWDMVVSDRTIYLATGTEGQLLSLDLTQQESPKVSVVLDTQQTNLLALGMDARGNVYAGTDTNGLIYRISFDDDGAPRGYVIYDAPEPEIGALLIMPDGTVFAGTADADQARPGRLEEAVGAETGRPGAPETPEVAPEEPEAPEAPPEVPNVPPDPEPMDPAPGAANNGAAKSGAANRVQANAAKQVVQAQQDEAAPAQDEPQTQIDETQTDADAEQAKPTAEQYDRMREVIRQRLQSARDGGEMQVQRGRARRPTARPASPAMHSRGGGRSAQPPKEGNAVYRIDPNGFVTEVFRESVMILKITRADGTLLVATGNEGQLFHIDPAADETTILADLEPQQIIGVMLHEENEDQPGSILAITANPAQVVRLNLGYADEGVYTSVPMDAGQISLWGIIRLTARIPEGTSVAVQTRSGNVEDPEQAMWSQWTEPQVLNFNPQHPALRPHELAVDSAPARFIQYRLTLRGTPDATSAVERVDLAYVAPNFKPAVTAISATYNDQGGRDNGSAEPSQILSASWEASDPNGDPLTFELEMKSADTDKWLPVAKDIAQPSYDWDTQLVPDGWYVLRVTASDIGGNPADMAKTGSRMSDPVLVDNTPPTLQKPKLRRTVGGYVADFMAEDDLSTIRSVHYTIDGDETWQKVLPTDLIYDSTSEEFSISISDLAPGTHVLTLRVLDAQNNARFHAVELAK